jgi:periplasmic divalent cation tolerance protein
MTSDIVFLYVPCASEEEARKIIHACIEKNVAACGNIFPGVISIYRWEGKMEEAWEVILVLKTSAQKAGAAEAEVRKLNSYKIPCIATLPVERLNDDYRTWLMGEIGGK